MNMTGNDTGPRVKWQLGGRRSAATTLQEGERLLQSIASPRERNARQPPVSNATGGGEKERGLLHSGWQAALRSLAVSPSLLLLMLPLDSVDDATGFTTRAAGPRWDRRLTP